VYKSMDIKYRTNRKGAPLGIFILLLSMFCITFLSPKASVYNPGFLIMCELSAALLFWVFFATYIIANDIGIYIIDWFIFKRGLPYKEIEEVWYYQYYKWGGQTRILAIKGKRNGRDKIVKLGGNKYFSEQTLSDVVFLIQKRNPNVMLDGASEDLLRRGTNR
jgi:hypothetical protein